MNNCWKKILPVHSTTVRFLHGHSLHYVREYKCGVVYFARHHACHGPTSLSSNLLKKTFFNFHLQPVHHFQMTRFYRIKTDATLTTEQAFVCKVAKVSPSDKKTLDELCSRLKYLVEKGCKVYELVEYPEILKLTLPEIDKCIERLHYCGQPSISMPLLKFAKPENSDVVVKNSLRRYRKQQNGYLNKTEEVKLALQCSDDEMLEILTRNSRLIGNRKRKFIVEKVKCLLECRASLEDIKCNTNLLNNKTLEDVETRARHLASLGYDPLPLGVVGRTDEEYAAIAERLAREKVLQPSCQYMDSKEIIAKIPEYSDKKLYVVKPKVDFLLSKGYMGDDIIGFPLILELSLGTIQGAVTYLHQHYLGLVSLELCHKYASAKRVTSRQRSVRKVFSKVLKCSSKELPQIPKDLSISFNQEATYQLNLEFLNSKGFTMLELKELPIVLAHDTEVLKLCWSILQCDETLVPYFELWKNNKKMLLQLLQYSVERKTNFSFAAVTGVDEEKKILESGSFLPLVYESQEFISSDAKEPDEPELDSNTGRDSHAENESLTKHDSVVELVELDADHDVNSELDSSSEQDSDEGDASNVKHESNMTAASNERHNILKPNSDSSPKDTTNSKRDSAVHFIPENPSMKPEDKDQQFGMESIMTELFSLSSRKSSSRDA